MHRRQLLTALAAAAADVVPSLALGATGRTAPASLPAEGEMPSLAGATGWIGTPPLAAAGLRGKVVLVQFWTYSCINWLRTLPYVRAWNQTYRDHGLVVIGVHTPEFAFEKVGDNIQRAVREMNVTHPVAIDSNYAIWRAFDNRYWPALYLVDVHGRVRHHHFGEGGYEETEAAIRQLLADAGTASVDRSVVRVQPGSVEAEADWADLKSPETYVGHERAERFASPGGAIQDRPHVYLAPARLQPGQWCLAGDWTIAQQLARSNRPGSRIVNRFHARDVHLVMGSVRSDSPVRIRVTFDGRAPGADRGVDVDERGSGVVAEPRLYQLLRQRGPIVDREVAIEFLDAGAEAYCFTFG